jgi:hypothetical protein
LSPPRALPFSSADISLFYFGPAFINFVIFLVFQEVTIIRPSRRSYPIGLHADRPTGPASSAFPLAAFAAPVLSFAALTAGAAFFIGGHSAFLFWPGVHKIRYFPCFFRKLR